MWASFIVERLGWSCEAYRACKQNAGISFLAGLTAGITQEAGGGFLFHKFELRVGFNQNGILKIQH